MTDKTTLMRLMAFMSPAFPVGAFSFSSGLESACRTGLVHDATSLREWIETSLTFGSLRTDSVILAAAYRREKEAAELSELSLALAGSAERHAELQELGHSFLNAASAWQTGFDDQPFAYPVAIALVASRLNTGLSATLTAFLHAAVSNQLQAALRLMPLGQAAATKLLAELETCISECADKAAQSTLDDLGTAAFAMDIAAMRHVDLPGRMFRS